VPEPPQSKCRSTNVLPNSPPSSYHSRPYRLSEILPPSLTLRRLRHSHSCFTTGAKYLETHDKYFLFSTEHLRLQSLCNILSDEKMGLSFTIAAGTRQRSHSRVRLPRDSWTYFTFSDSRLPQPVGPGPRIYIPHEQRGPVIPPGTWFPFRRLLWLAGLRWRYSNPPPHGVWRLNFVYIIYKNVVPTSQETHYVSAKKPSRLMLFRETVAVYCENHAEHTNTYCVQNAEFWLC
jgi:hypothetical protein